MSVGVDGNAKGGMGARDVLFTLVELAGLEEDGAEDTVVEERDLEGEECDKPSREASTRYYQGVDSWLEDAGHKICSQ